MVLTSSVGPILGADLRPRQSLRLSEEAVSPCFLWDQFLFSSLRTSECILGAKTQALILAPHCLPGPWV